jgi:type IV secretion system protein VirB9
MIRKLILAGTALAFAMPLQAADRRLVSRHYNAEEVIQLDGQAGVQASIAFAEDEHIENVAVGDSTAWQITPNKRANLLFVKPLAARARTNMTVITDRRTYFFDLVAAPSARPIYLLRFTYPDEPKTESQLAAAPALNTDEARLAEGEKPVDPAQLNFAWSKRGDSKLLPAQVYDDGTATYLSWSQGVSLPAILIRDEKGTEGPVNYAVRGDVIVIEGVPTLIQLRAGKKNAQLEFRGPARPAPAPPSTPASAPVASATELSRGK